MNPSTVRRMSLWLAMGLASCGSPAMAQMPDVRQMSGIAMPSGDVPPGTVVVRVIRGDLSNNVANQPVELHLADRVATARTDATGRATFAKLAPNVSMHAIATVEGERLESSAIVLDSASGVRVLLVAGAGASSPRPGTAPSATVAAASPVQEGEIVIGGQSRIHVEFDDEQIEVFYLLEVVNRGASPVALKEDLRIPLPPGALSPAMLEGSSTLAQVREDVVVVSGPLAPGPTPVQVAFGLSGGRPDYVLRQSLPLRWEQVQVVVSRVGNVQSSSEQFASNTVMPGEGQSFLLGTGPTLPAGKELGVRLTGLPTRSRVGRWCTLTIGLIILLTGAWAARRGRRATGEGARGAVLEARRQKLLADLARLDGQPATHGDASRRAARCSDLKAQLERIYGELDRHDESAGML
jgi:hypothetical protein